MFANCAKAAIAAVSPTAAADGGSGVVTGHPERRHQQRGAASRTALLDAGVEILREEAPRMLSNVLGPRAVARRAMRSTGSFFHHWPSAEAYLDDLIEHIFRSGLLPENVDDVTDSLSALVEDPPNSAAAIEGICRATFLHIVQDPNLGVELLLRAQPDDEQISDGLRSFYREIDAISQKSHEAVASIWDREPRPPLDYDSITIIFTAVLEGLTIRHLVDPERVPPERFGEAVLALLPVVLRATGDERHLRDVVTESLAKNGVPNAFD